MDAPALAAAIGGSVVGLAGIGLAWWNGLQDREHQRRLAAEARAYDARAKTYLDLLTTLGEALREMEAVNPVAVNEQRRVAREGHWMTKQIEEGLSSEQRIQRSLTRQEERLRLSAMLAAFGSDAVRAATEEFFSAEDTFASHWSNPEAYVELDEAVGQAREALVTLEALVRHELASYAATRL